MQRIYFICFPPEMERERREKPEISSNNRPYRMSESNQCTVDPVFKGHSDERTPYIQ